MIDKEEKDANDEGADLVNGYPHSLYTGGCSEHPQELARET